MYKIYLDTTKRFEKNIKLVSVDDTVETVVEKIEGDFDVTVKIAELLKGHSLTLEQVSEVVPNTGPGSFTGIKTGVTIANIINWASGKKDISELYRPEYGSEPNITPRRAS